MKGFNIRWLICAAEKFRFSAEKVQFSAKNFQFRTKKIQLNTKKFQFRAKKKILFTAKNKLKLVPKKIQKITNRVDWTLCKRVCDMLPCLSLRLKSRMGNYPTITHTF